MKHLFHHLFLPHHTNNQRPKILHFDSVFGVVAIFLVATLLLTNLKKHNPQVLGTSINIAAQDLLKLTNQQRQSHGVGALVLNDQLTKAAQMKADDMFAENYWAHNSPSGKMPWDFIKASGYDYIYAGENLARGFTNANDVVTAWMNSPSHRENLLSPNYRDVGFAVEEGNLTGEKDTVLIVEELGNTTLNTNAANNNAQHVSGAEAPHTALPPVEIPNTSVNKSPLIDTRILTKNIALSIILLFILVFLVDLIIIKRKKIVRFVGHNLDHIIFLGTVGAMILMWQVGSIL